jgi:hypothetical protein
MAFPAIGRAWLIVGRRLIDRTYHIIHAID